MTATKGPIDREKQRNREANAFAMALLMPEKMLRGDCAKFADEHIQDRLDQLAKRYAVEPAIMMLRLIQLGLVQP